MANKCKEHGIDGKYVVKWRTWNMISQRALAKRLGIDHTYLGKIEAGTCYGTIDILMKLHEVTGAPYEYLLK